MSAVLSSPAPHPAGRNREEEAGGAGGPSFCKLVRQTTASTDDETTTCCSSSNHSLAGDCDLLLGLDALSASTHSTTSSCGSGENNEAIALPAPTPPCTPTKSSHLASSSSTAALRPRRQRSAQDIRNHYACKLGIRDSRTEMLLLATHGGSLCHNPQWRRVSCLPENVRPVIEKLKGRPESYGGFLRLMKRQSQVGNLAALANAPPPQTPPHASSPPHHHAMYEPQQPRRPSCLGQPPPCPSCLGQPPQQPPMEEQEQQHGGRGGALPMPVPRRRRSQGSVGHAEDDEQLLDDDDVSLTSSTSSSYMSWCSCSSPPVHALQYHPIGSPPSHNMRGGRRVGGLKRSGKSPPTAPLSIQHAVDEAVAASSLGRNGSSGSMMSTCSSASSSSTSTPAKQQPQLPGGKRRIVFHEEVCVVHIPSHKEYSTRVKTQYWNSPEEIYEMACRNLVEFEAEGYAWERALEEDQLFWCPDSGEFVHPAHICLEPQQQGQGQQQQQSQQV